MKKNKIISDAMLWNSIFHELCSTVSLSEIKQKLRHCSFELDTASLKSNFSDMIS